MDVFDVDHEVRTVLREARLPARLAPRVLAAYALERHASASGVSQALALAAQTETPESASR
jgi:hypothetical protein